MSKRASKRARQALREKLVPEHECVPRHRETVIHDDGLEQHCYHYECTTLGCNIMMGINLSGPRVTSHKWTEED